MGATAVSGPNLEERAERRTWAWYRSPGGPSNSSSNPRRVP